MMYCFMDTVNVLLNLSGTADLLLSVCCPGWDRDSYLGVAARLADHAMLKSSRPRLWLKRSPLLFTCLTLTLNLHALGLHYRAYLGRQGCQ